MSSPDTPLPPVQYTTSGCAGVRFAPPAEVVRIYTGLSDAIHQWPPPGATPHPVLANVWCSDAAAGSTYWGTVTEVIESNVGSAGEGLSLAADALRLYNNLPSAVRKLLLAGEYPMLYSTGGKRMRWIRTSLRGLLSDQEQFQHKFDWGVPGNDPDYSEAQLLAFAQQVATTWNTTTMLTTKNLYGFLATDVVYTEVGAAQYTYSDPLAGSSNVEATAAQWYMWPVASRPKGGAGTSLPYEVSMCVTLLTDTRGARGRGRFYLPPLGTAAMGAKGRYSSMIPGMIAQDIDAFFEAMRTAHPALRPVVVSQAAGQLHQITSISVGDVPDSQRRRRNAQSETRAQSGLTAYA